MSKKINRDLSDRLAEALNAYSKSVAYVPSYMYRDELRRVSKAHQKLHRKSVSK